MPDDPQITVVAKANRGTVIWRGSIVAMIAGLYWALGAWTDQHNAPLYVSQAQYRSDRESAKELAGEKEKDLDRRLDGEEAWLKNISDSIRQLMNREAYGSPRGYTSQPAMADKQ